MTAAEINRQPLRQKRRPQIPTHLLIQTVDQFVVKNLRWQASGVVTLRVRNVDFPARVTAVANQSRQ